MISRGGNVTNIDIWSELILGFQEDLARETLDISRALSRLATDLNGQVSTDWAYDRVNQIF